MTQTNHTENSNGNSTGRKLEWLKDFQFKPGQTGNPGGRPKEQKPLRSMLLAYLQGLDDQELKKLEKWAKRKKNRKNDQEPQTWTRAQKLIAELFRRAMSDSDFLMKEIIERVDGKLAADTEKERLGDQPPTVVVIDIPRPRRPVPQLPDPGKNGQ
jgi:Family of unknown function (DUF5681)